MAHVPGIVRLVMGLHKLLAGDGYTYLTRHTAAADATDRGYSSLADLASSVTLEVASSSTARLSRL